jgi:hypothetical protein
MDACGLMAGQRPLTIEEVRAAGRPALFSAFGDHLAYLDGTIYALPREPDQRDLANLPSLPGAYEITTVVGIEYGWYQFEDCLPAAHGEDSQAPTQQASHPTSSRSANQSHPSLRGRLLPAGP